MEFISDKELIARLSFDNPWWSGSGKEEIGPQYPRKRIFYQAFSSRVRELAAAEILLLAGPLRAGKTVMMRQLIAQLIESGTPPGSVFYCSLAIPSIASVSPEKLLNLFMDRNGNGPDREVYVFFDEAQYLRDWEKALLLVAKKWPRAHIICAVSSAAPSLITGKTTSGGRLSCFVLPPLTFAEFLRLRGTEEKLLGNGKKSMAVSADALNALNEEFILYVNSGGFMEGVPAKTEGGPAAFFIRDGIADGILHKDLASLSGINDTRELSRLLALIALNTAREVTIEELAKAIGIAKNTLRKYLNHLEQAFLIRRLPRVDKAARRFQRAVAFKVYLTSPSLYAAMFGPAAPGDDVFPRLAETAVLTQWLGAGAMENQAYASWKGGGIDLLSMASGSDRPDHVFEIDWADSYTGAGKGPKTLTDFVRGANPAASTYILTRTTARLASMAGVDITLVPLALYAYWIGRDPVV